mmetsp:Transcript_18046/g.54369  ORF Transcript_18046/g.54369 Transcript_18046/m.54369 type:complete len:95 (-) Transcript_18046:917-1201(-)
MNARRCACIQGELLCRLFDVATRGGVAKRPQKAWMTARASSADHDEHVGRDTGRPQTAIGNVDEMENGGEAPRLVTPLPSASAFSLASSSSGRL